MITQAPPVSVARPQATQYANLALGLSTPNNHLQIVGLTAGKSAGQPGVAAAQASPYGQGDWTPVATRLTGATPPATLKHLAITADTIGCEAVGLGNDGKIDRAGRQFDGPWVSDTGPVTQPMTFVPGSLSAHVLNTATVFAAAATDNAPWVALYRDQSTPPQWQPGFALPNPTHSEFQFVAACPDLSDAGTTHVIGLTTGGRACEVATTSGRGTGPTDQQWTGGFGFLGNASGLPAFSQLVLISGDAAQNLHVLGHGLDGSVWDIAQYSLAPVNGGWKNHSTLIYAGGQKNLRKIACFLTPALTLNLVGSALGQLWQLATYDVAWKSDVIPLPLRGTCTDWHLAPNPVVQTGTDAFIIGLGGTGLVYEMLVYQNGAWAAGAPGPIGG